ncbi:MAG: hypothetical protein JOZ00_03570 [Mycobacterium sp.]|uniref:hypothetical protein n=1 Tax=Mycobacterium sp. TaxID=1785 RepID=UPI001EBE1826|nr:hypothetical protein [Mycobacterium sp.]MBV8785747.1 hypothetical protein [Mycobacterium sp.]
MPIVTHHLAAGQYTDEQVQHLATANAPATAEILERPMDRIRGFVRLYRPQMYLVASETVAHATLAAPYLGPPRELVRSGAIEIEPNDWAIGGAPASVCRRDDVPARPAAHR